MNYTTIAEVNSARERLTANRDLFTDSAYDAASKKLDAAAKEIEDGEVIVAFLDENYAETLDSVRASIDPGQSKQFASARVPGGVVKLAFVADKAE